jgi:hypothetical protein
MLVFSPNPYHPKLRWQRLTPLKRRNIFSVFMFSWLIFILTEATYQTATAKTFIQRRWWMDSTMEILFTVIKWEQIVLSSMIFAAARVGDKHIFMYFSLEKLFHFIWQAKFISGEITITFLIKSFLTRIHLSTYIIPRLLSPLWFISGKFMSLSLALKMEVKKA